MPSSVQLLYNFKKPNDIIKAQTSQKIGGYTLGNLELEFESVDSQEIANEVKSMYSAGRTLTYVHATLLKTSEWDKDSTLHENVNLPEGHCILHKRDEG